MKGDTTRRGFLSGAAGVLAGAAGALGGQQTARAAVDNDSAGFRLGVASYSLREFQRGLAIKMIKELKTPYVSVKEMHLPYRAAPEELDRGRKEFEKAGLKIMSGGNNSIQKPDDADVKFYFEYARMCGMPMLVIAPTRQTMPIIEKYVREYNIKVALHNHGPEDKHFPTPKSVLDVVKDMDPRCGLCMDVGHTARTGADPVEWVSRAGARLLDMHIKDLKSTTEKGSQCDVGEGAINIPALFRELKKAGYTGCVNLEYEINGENPLPGMKSSFAYMRGVLAGMRA